MSISMKYYALVHQHRHGTSIHGLKSNRELTVDDAIAYLEDDFEQDRDDEWIELEKLSFIEVS